MIQLILLFILTQLALLARYIVFDAFDPVVYASTFLFLPAAAFIYFFSRHKMKKERAFAPKDIQNWSFYTVQKVFKVAKPLYKGTEKRGYILRYYVKKWHYVVSDIIGASLFLAIHIEIDGHLYNIVPNSKKWRSVQSHWTIYKDDVEIGHAQTAVTLKNSAKLTEAIDITFGNESYTTSAKTVTSAISVLQQDKVVATMKRDHMVSNVHVLQADEDAPEALLALILHAYYFKNA